MQQYSWLVATTNLLFFLHFQTNHLQSTAELEHADKWWSLTCNKQADRWKLCCLLAVLFQQQTCFQIISLWITPLAVCSNKLHVAEWRLAAERRQALRIWLRSIGFHSSQCSLCFTAMWQESIKTSQVHYSAFSPDHIDFSSWVGTPKNDKRKFQTGMRKLVNLELQAENCSKYMFLLFYW